MSTRCRGTCGGTAPIAGPTKNQVILLWPLGGLSVEGVKVLDECGASRGVDENLAFGHALRLEGRVALEVVDELQRVIRCRSGEGYS